MNFWSRGVSIVKKFVLGVLCCGFFALYFKIIIKTIWYYFVPWNTFTDVLAVFITLIVIIPLAVVSAYGCEKIIKKAYNKES